MPSSTFRVRLSSSVIWGGPCAGRGVSVGPARPEKDAAALAATRSACFCASRSACCLFRRSSSACTFTSDYGAEVLSLQALYVCPYSAAINRDPCAFSSALPAPHVLSTHSTLLAPSRPASTLSGGTSLCTPNPTNSGGRQEQWDWSAVPAHTG